MEKIQMIDNYENSRDMSFHEICETSDRMHGMMYFLDHFNHIYDNPDYIPTFDEYMRCNTKIDNSSFIFQKKTHTQTQKDIKKLFFIFQLCLFLRPFSATHKSTHFFFVFCFVKKAKWCVN